MKTRRIQFLLILFFFLFLLGLASLATGVGPAKYGNKVEPGEFVIEPPTLICLGFEWYIEGDDNRNAAVKVSYRKKGNGDPAWKEALPLLRLQYEQTGQYVAPNMFAGSIFDLEPDTEYECRFIMSDPDGVSGENDKLVTVRTRAELIPFDGGRTLHVYPYGYTGEKLAPSYTGLNSAYRRAEAGDIILVHAGVYEDDRNQFLGRHLPTGRFAFQNYGLDFFGTYRFAKGGSPDKPIVIKAADDGDVIFDGNGCFNLFNVMKADYLYFEGLTFRNTDLAIWAGEDQLAGCSGLTIKYCRFEDVGYGIRSTYNGSENFYITDNVIIGRHDLTKLTAWVGGVGIPWETFPDFPAYINGPTGSLDGIKVSGRGHVVAHNHVEGFHDGIDVAGSVGETVVAIDFYNNYITNVSDNCIEIDYAHHNIRAIRNYCINGAHVPLESMPNYGGPAYWIRNITYHTPERGSLKFYSRPAGEIVYNNTLCSEAAVGYGVVPPQAASNVHLRNNLILAENPLAMTYFQPDFHGIFFMDTYTNYTTSDYNGFLPNEGAQPQFVWNSPPFDVLADYDNPREQRGFNTLAEYSQATGQDKHSVLIDYGIFQNVAKPDISDPTALYSPGDLDFRLLPDSVAVDAGVILPNINDDFTGRAPDLGALEVGKPMPIYGPRQ